VLYEIIQKVTKNSGMTLDNFKVIKSINDHTFENFTQKKMYINLFKYPTFFIAPSLILAFTKQGPYVDFPCQISLVVFSVLIMKDEIYQIKYFGSEKYFSGDKAWNLNDWLNILFNLTYYFMYIFMIPTEERIVFGEQSENLGMV